MVDWDVVVIGGGPAGLTAAAAAAGMDLSCLVIDCMGGGGELMNLGSLRELDEILTGPDLAARLLEEAVCAGAELGIGEVTGLTRERAGWHVSTDQESHSARAVILAVGLAPGFLGLDGEDRLEGQGLSHCAACDGPLYRGQPVVVAGADRWAQQEAHDLAAESEVTLITQGDALPADVEAFAVVRGRIIGLEAVSRLEAVLVQSDAGGTPRRIPAHAVFVQTGRRPALSFAPEILARDEGGRLVTDVALQTNLPRLFAAGDARVGALRTAAAAMTEGRRAAESVRATLFPLGKNAD